jgi:hypothetical protein
VSNVTPQSGNGMASLLPGGAKKSLSGATGFDSDTALSASVAQAFVQNGFSFVIRYLSLGESEDEGDLSTAEARDILNSGLAVMAAQHVDYPGWTPSETLGSQYGANAAANAQKVGLPAGMNIWLDLEGVDESVSSSDVIAYCNAWFAAVAGAGYIPGLYVGADAILNSEELYYDLDVEYYWHSGSDVPPVDVRGYCMVQTINDAYEIDGCAYCRDVIQADSMGSTPVWLILEPSPPIA